MTDTRPIHVAVIAPLPVASVENEAERLHRAERPFGESRHSWTLRAGTGAYAAAFTREPGTECSEWPLAERLSQLTQEPVYSLWLDSDNPRMIYEFRGGKRIRDREGDPIEHARSLGVDLATIGVTDAGAAPSVTTVAVVDGVASPRVRDLLGDMANEDWLRIDDIGSSTVLSAGDGDLRSAPWELTDALPDHDVYFVHGDRGRRELNIQVLRGGETTGTFYVPPVSSAESVSAIKGATTVSGILDALGIAPELMPRDGWGR